MDNSSEKSIMNIKLVGTHAKTGKRAYMTFSVVATDLNDAVKIIKEDFLLDGIVDQIWGELESFGGRASIATSSGFFK